MDFEALKLRKGRSGWMSLLFTNVSRKLGGKINKGLEDKSSLK